MNVKIQPNGVLRITAESETEVFALQEWMNKASFREGDKLFYEGCRILLTEKRESAK